MFRCKFGDRRRITMTIAKVCQFNRRRLWKRRMFPIDLSPIQLGQWKLPNGRQLHLRHKINQHRKSRLKDHSARFFPDCLGRQVQVLLNRHRKAQPTSNRNSLLQSSSQTLLLQAHRGRTKVTFSMNWLNKQVWSLCNLYFYLNAAFESPSGDTPKDASYSAIANCMKKLLGELFEFGECHLIGSHVNGTTNDDHSSLLDIYLNLSKLPASLKSTLFFAKYIQWLSFIQTTAIRWQ